MKYTQLSGIALLLAGGIMAGSPAWAVDRGTMLANTCVGCHGPNGNSVGPASPNIAGLSAETMYEMMKSFQDARPSTIMGRIAKGYTDEELKQMSEYFAKQKPVAREQQVDADKAAKGAKLHEEYCEKCHEEKGVKDSDGSGILAGQWMPYMQWQLADFTGGSREMSKKMAKRMEAMVKEHGEGSLEEIANFYASHK
jgi:sulfide dehydrogenase cytochrome subunit